MIDLTGGNLVAYLLRVIKDVVNRNPRFRKTLGQASFASSNQINFGDCQVIIKSVTTQGTRLSPDYFMCTQHGHAITAKVEDKEGSFVEWVNEYNRSILVPGVYYLNVDSVDEKTNEVGFTIQKYLWEEGRVSGAIGSKIFFRDGINPAAMSYFNGANNAVLTVGVDIQVPLTTTYSLLRTPVDSLYVQFNSTPLIPLADYWYEREIATDLGTTIGGYQDITVPTGYTKIRFEDQDGYVLREGVDFAFIGPDKIRLTQWSPAGSTLTAHTTSKVDPTNNNPIHPENFLNIELTSGQTVAPGQVFIRTTAGDVFQLTARPDGQLVLPQLLGPGEYADYEVRIDDGKTQAVGKKFNLNANLVPGIWIAVGDAVVEDDQVAIIVSPTLTETYQVYGSKENLTFVIDVKANDYMTASEISELIKRELLVTRRDNMEGDGVTIYEATRSDNPGQQRDGSGINPSYTYTISVTAAADWKVFIPLVTRLVSVDVTNTFAQLPDFPGKLHLAPRMQALGAFAFIPSYA